MNVKIRIPASLSGFVLGNREVVVSGNTVQENLRNLIDKHGSIADKLFDSSGKLRRFINLYLNERDIRELDGVETVISDGDVISIIPAFSGG
ncbi:MoaD/ThiS family protein [Exilibacterium tricleocarpae]|uniref:MoaD/ThiS family protein n=1 Tax=Exilibacterium tricleocarpae TaxID=2591008 RepID=A0A545U480_9GAMM|nr:MoaD/ThiS family protein [Exilibacterium tricleocarpae]TQV84268.1 MoaD/ThiS family protein [Exilibacterium tricleocarpae]